MSAAQALTSGLPSSSSGVRSTSGGGSAAERGPSSFRDTLETASRSSEPPVREEGRVSSDDAHGRKGSQSDAGGKGDEGASRGGDGMAHRSEAVSELSAIFSALGAAGETSDGETGFAALARAMSAGAGANGGEPDVGLWMPGQVGDSGEAPDANRLLLLLKSGVAAKAAAAAGADVVDIKFSVAGQETHLALDKSSSEALALLAAQDAADATAKASGNGKAAVLGAALSQAADEAVQSARARGGVAADPAAFKADASAAARVGTVAEEGTGRGGALADQGVSGQQGRSPDGRGASSNGSSQQQGTGAFTLAGGAPQVPVAVRDAAAADAGYEPVSSQIADEVRAELRADGLGKGSSEGVVKVLHLELKPANLGSVTVKLTLKDNAISIQLEAQRLDTLAVIERERQALTNALTSAGYTVDSISAVPQSEAGRSQGAVAGFGDSSSGSQGGPSGQTGQGEGLGSSNGEGRSDQPGTGHSAHRHPSDDNDASVSGVRRDADGLYV